MRTGLIEHTIAILLATTLAISGCSENANNGGTGGGGTGAGMGGGAGGNTGGGGTGGGTTVTSLPASKALGTLTAAEATQLCDDVKAYYGTAITKASSCKWSAIFGAASSSSPNNMALQNNCTTMETACNQSADTGPGKATSCLPIPSDCTATVAQYAACIVAGAMVLNQSANTLPSCATVTLADLTPVFNANDALNAPPGCMPLANACPALAFPIAN
jgi:hypothetical protein